MTLLDDRVATAERPAVVAPGHRANAPLRAAARWRFAARLARREVRRRPGRTLLVMLLVAVPVMAMTVASIVARTNSASHAATFARSFGAADLALDGYSQLPALPALDGARRVEFGRAWAPVVTATGADYLLFTDVPLDDPITKGVVDLSSGRVPAAAGEVLLSPSSAAKLRVHIGDRVVFTTPAATFTVVGLGRLAADWNQPLMVVKGFDPSVIDHNGVWQRTMLVDLPPQADAAAIARGLLPIAVGRVDTPLADPLSGFTAPARVGRVGGAALAWGWVAGALALATLGIVVTAAFASSARRQLVTLGQLSANGADAKLLRRTLALQGAWSGLLGSVLGVAGGVGVLLAGRSVVERFSRHAVPHYRVAGSDLTVIVVTGVVAATVAAALPARDVSRIPTLTALGGRRPLGQVPRRLAPIGLLLFLGGTGLLVLVTLVGHRSLSGMGGNLGAAVAVVGGLGVLAGACCIAPVVVGGLGLVAERSSGIRRLAGRSLARTRTRSAAVVAAITATAAFALGGSLAFASVTAQDGSSNAGTVYVPDDAVLIQGYLPQDSRVSSADLVPLISSLHDRVAAKFTELRWSPMRSALASPIATGDGTAGLAAIPVADPQVLDLVGLSARDLATLRSTGVLAFGTFGTPAAISGTGWPMNQDPPASMGGGIPALITADRATELGFPVVVTGEIGRSDHPFTNSAYAALSSIAQFGGSGFDPFVRSAEPVPGTEVASVGLNYGGGSGFDVTPWVTPAIGALALVLTLLVVGIGLALAAAESRDERDVLVAVGARPRTLRRVAGVKALFMAGAGCLVAVPVGLLPVWGVLRASGRSTVVVPWLGIGLIVVAVPAIAGGVAWFGSSVAQAVKPTRMSTLGD